MPVSDMCRELQGQKVLEEELGEAWDQGGLVAGAAFVMEMGLSLVLMAGWTADGRTNNIPGPGE